jgi:ribose 5-phosphate isomerase B
MIAVGCDHAGFALKQAVIRIFNERGLEYKDFGAYSDCPCDYPEYAKAVCASLLSGEAERGVLVCGTGIGVSIVANRFKGINCALCGDVFSAKACRAHNNANVLALGARVVGEGLAGEILRAFLDTPFENTEKRANRIKAHDE